MAARDRTEPKSPLAERYRAASAAFARTLAEAAGDGNALERLCRAGIEYLAYAERNAEDYNLLFTTDLLTTELRTTDLPATDLPTTDLPTTAAGNVTPSVDATFHALAGALQAEDRLRTGLGDPDVLAQTLWAALHGAAALNLMENASPLFTGFASRRARFTAALELILRGVLDDPDTGCETLARLLAERRNQGKS